MIEANRFDTSASTWALQEAVRTHDLDELRRLVSDHFVFSSSRSITRLGESGYSEQPGKAEWITAAESINWRKFEIDHIRSIDLGDTVVVDSRLTQVVNRDGYDQRTSWVVTDVWSKEGAEWRLVSRHPELASTDQ